MSRKNLKYSKTTEEDQKKLQKESEKELNKKIKEKLKIDNDFKSGKLLPVNCEEDKDILKSFGIKFTRYKDTILKNVKLPEKWKIIPSLHEVDFFYLVDDESRKRAFIIYRKDTKMIFIHKRFHCESIPEKDGVRGLVFDGEKVIHKTKLMKYKGKIFENEYFKVLGKVSKLAYDYLNKNYPKWEDHKEYWTRKN